jgi:hypothetical protein
MNERIKELAEQAEILITEVGAFHNTPHGAYQLQEQHMKKFAELIVQECAGIVQTYMSRWPEDAELTKQIKQHFGVEE